MTSAVVRPLPVLYACAGCAEHGDRAHELGARLEREGKAEMVWLGARPDLSRRSRYPIIALDGCGKACAARWLEQRGVVPDRAWQLAA